MMRTVFILFIVFFAGCVDSERGTNGLKAQSKRLEFVDTKSTCGNDLRKLSPMKILNQTSENRAKETEFKLKKKFALGKQKNVAVKKLVVIDYSKWAKPLHLKQPENYKKKSLLFESERKKQEKKKKFEISVLEKLKKKIFSGAM